MPDIAVALKTELATCHGLMNVTDSGNAEFYLKQLFSSVDMSHLADTRSAKSNSTLNL